MVRTYGILCQQAPSIEASADTIQECQIALQCSVAAGDMNGEAMMMTDLAGLYCQQGDLVRAEKMWRQAIQEFRQIGNPEGVATALSNLGSADLMRGDLAKRKGCCKSRCPAIRPSKTRAE